MLIKRVEEGDILRKWWDDATRMYFEYDEKGVQTSSRPYTADENAETDLEQSRDLVRSAVRAIVTDIKTEQDRAQTVIDSVSATREDKDNARAIKRMASAVIDLAKFVKDF